MSEAASSAVAKSPRRSGKATPGMGVHASDRPAQAKRQAAAPAIGWRGTPRSARRLAPGPGTVEAAARSRPAPIGNNTNKARLDSTPVSGAPTIKAKNPSQPSRRAAVLGRIVQAAVRDEHGEWTFSE